MIKLSGRQQLELSLLCLDVMDYPQERVWDHERDCFAAEYIARRAALVTYVRAEGIGEYDFGEGLSPRELRGARFAASLLKWAGDGWHPDSLGGRILAAAGVPFKIDEDDEGAIPF